MIFAVLVAKSQTSIPPGYVSGIWSLAGSPYLIQGSVQVPNDSTLIIEPGVTVNFQGHYKLMVLGRLLANGNITDSIFFTATDTISGWYGIRFDNTPSTNDSSFFSYCNIQWGKANGIGNDAYGGAFMFNNFSKAKISNSVIKNNSNYSIYCLKSSPTISYSNISYSKIGGGLIVENNSNPNIYSNTISYNAGRGIDYRWNSGNINCIMNVTNNLITYNSDFGIYCSFVSGNISNNTISFNNPTNKTLPGGIWCDNSTVSISNNIISYNKCSASGYGGGIFSYFGSAIISNNIIANNIAPKGAGISIIAGSPIIFDNIISNNTSNGTYGYGAGIYCAASSPILTNNTISNNSANSGGGLYCTATSNPTFNNCVFYGNTATLDGAQIYSNDETSDPNFYYCNVQGGSSSFGLNGNFYSGTYSNNLDLDPLFVSPSSGTGINFDGVNADWSLQSTSPCINTGDPSGTYPSTDIAGNPRIYGATIDIGAYEFQGLVGVLNYNLENQIYFYPNPTSNQISIDTKLDISEIIIIDITGKIIMITKQHTNVVNVADLLNGIYFIKLITDERIITKKFVKQ